MKAFRSFTITLVIILVIGGIFLFAQKSIKKDVESSAETIEANNEEKTSTANPIKKAIVSEAMDQYIEKSDGKVKEIAESMSEEDKDTVSEIIANNVELEDIPEVQSYISSGDTAGLMEYAQDNLSSEEQAELAEIMLKYALTP
ncbi:hypothetical protein D6855_00500 [Butyrivibrio sp. CB08]|uniref:hypothetical protein n=1 Tax=Butyrivibrio sp. CB08 TaxID=2364879 RepID=UPI000EAAAD78|nr:hypothetical protein [Butyrivibrio sp. CB08]RKM61931.1 hypothetical protein D6855_00500 [Butyrivibrio sp. CB08]